MITSEQNTEKQLRRLAAQRQLYATAKTVFALQVLLTGPIAVTTSAVAIALSAAKGYCALWGIAVSLVDLLVFAPWTRHLRNVAARVQEQFDCDVLSLPWNDVKAGARPDPELVKEQADKYNKWASTMPTLRDWYPVAFGDLPLHIGRVACQRTNCWWDSKQRRRYATCLISTVVLVFAVMLALAIAQGLTVEGFVLKVAAPLSPTLLLGIRQFREHGETASRLDRLKEHSERLWDDALAGRPAPEVTARSRALQDEILENRRKSPLVFDGIYKWLRTGYESQMNASAEELVSEAKRKLMG